MKKNLYYATVYQRNNLLRDFILSFFLGISSYPRLILEVFLRKNMGERYFSLASAITIAVVLAFIPMSILRFEYPLFTVIARNLLYYAFLAAFLVFSAFRYREVKREPSVFDFARFSKTGGRVNPIFFKIKLFGREPDIRTVEIWYEALPFFVLGWLLILLGLGTFLGPLLVICAIIYSLSHAGGYKRGDDFLMDKIDEIICNEDLTDAFVKDRESPRGFRWYGKKPSSEDLREEYVEDICYEDDEDEATEAR